jgi:sugar phosphate isomerase/epimerase
MKTAVTISLVKEAEGGPFVYWHDLERACKHAHELGFDAIELFAPGPETVPVSGLKDQLETYQLKLAAVGTGAGWVVQRLSLTSPVAEIRDQARDFITSMIRYGATCGAPAIIGSMQGNISPEVPLHLGHSYLQESLDILGEVAEKEGTVLLYEPLNRYETKLINRLDQGVELLQGLQSKHVKLLADLFHMNIEEKNIADAFIAAGAMVGHIHFVDSNRQAVGFGHLDHKPIIAALRKINYQGYLSAEAFALPDSLTAAQQTISGIRALLQESRDEFMH